MQTRLVRCFSSESQKLQKWGHWDAQHCSRPCSSLRTPSWMQPDTARSSYCLELFNTALLTSGLSRSDLSFTEKAPDPVERGLIQKVYRAGLILLLLFLHLKEQRKAEEPNQGKGGLHTSCFFHFLCATLLVFYF